VPIKNTTGGKTFPKRGRLGSGAFFPDGVPIRGNVFGPNADQVVTPTPPADRVFGTPSNAGNGTQFGQSRVDTGVGLDHPNAGFLSLAKQNRVPAMTQASAATTQESPFGHVPVVQPSERNRLHQKKVTPVYKTQSGATRTHLSDSAFHRNPPKQKPFAPVKPQTNTTRVMQRVPVASFRSQNNLWADPNNSFLQGKANIDGAVGRGRWSTVKRGAAG
jgi:hypothetical protein